MQMSEETSTSRMSTPPAERAESISSQTGEMAQLRKAVIEARNLIIKTDNLLKNLHAEPTLIGRPQGEDGRGGARSRAEGVPPAGLAHRLAGAGPLRRAGAQGGRPDGLVPSRERACAGQGVPGRHRAAGELRQDGGRQQDGAVC